MSVIVARTAREVVDGGTGFGTNLCFVCWFAGGVLWLEDEDEQGASGWYFY